ncbi:MAG: type II toxin-antitoxin system HicA family toxin [Anaerolineales bacterium]|nr:type II toxin-antitoxin system HicA family toxin [Anaerolineales bacterium]
MPPLPVISGGRWVKALEKIGFLSVCQTGSHIIVRCAEPLTTIPIPDHKELAPGTLRSIIRQAGLSIAEFIALL